MDLILWRHAEAEDTLPDSERVLTARGAKQAWKMGEWLDANLPNTCRVFASPTIRTLQTAEALGRKFKRLDALAPGATVEEILAAVHWPLAREAVLIVGHQPILGQVAARLLAGVDQAWTIRKGNIWWISRRGGDADVATRAVLAPAYDATTSNYLRAVIGPDLVNKALAR